MPTPGGPRNSTSRASRMNRQVARSKICFLWIDGLKDQLNWSRGFTSRNRAALTRRAICRSWRTSSSSCKISSRNSAWLSWWPAASCNRTSKVWARPESRSSRSIDNKRSFMGFILLFQVVRDGRVNYTGSVRRNGVGLCWRATRQGIAGPGRKHFRRALGDDCPQGRFVGDRPEMLLSSHAFQNARRRRPCGPTPRRRLRRNRPAGG